MVNKLLPSLLLQWGEGGSGLGGPSHLPCPYSLAGGVGGGGRDSGRGLTPLLPHPTPTPRSPGSPGALRRAESRSGGGVFPRLGRGPGVSARGPSAGSPGEPRRSRAQTYLETWVRSRGPWPLFPEASHHRRAAALGSALATATRPGRRGIEPLQCSASAGRAVA